jgi:hypothetical protein
MATTPAEMDVEPSDNVTVHVRVNPKDLKILTRFMRRAPEWRSYWRYYIANVGFVLALFVVGIRGADGWWGAPVAGTAIVNLVAVRRFVRDQYGVAAAATKSTINASPSGFCAVQPGVESTVAWTAIDRTQVTDTHILFRLSPLSGYVLPRRCFRSTTDADRFVELLLADRKTPAA